jgi:hypothetical protein
MLFYHVRIAADPRAGAQAQERATLERLARLRTEGAVVGVAVTPDGGCVDLFCSLEDPRHAARLVEPSPLFGHGVWTAYTSRCFERFLEPWAVPPVDPGRRATVIEGRATDLDMASFVLVEARGAGRLAFGGFFDDASALMVMRSADPAEARDWLGETGFWDETSLTARPVCHVL